MQATRQAATWLESQLKESKARVDQDQQRLAAFQREHGLLTTPETLANGKQGETEHTPAMLEIDELGRQLVTASTDRILREAQYSAAQQGDPELVIASDPRLQAESGNFATALLQQIHARKGCQQEPRGMDKIAQADAQQHDHSCRQSQSTFNRHGTPPFRFSCPQIGFRGTP